MGGNEQLWFEFDGQNEGQLSLLSDSQIEDLRTG